MCCEDGIFPEGVCGRISRIHGYLVGLAILVRGAHDVCVELIFYLKVGARRPFLYSPIYGGQTVSLFRSYCVLVCSTFEDKCTCSIVKRRVCHYL